MAEKTEDSTTVEAAPSAIGPGAPPNGGGGVGDGPTIPDLIRRLIEFRDARDWRQFHTAKNLMLSLALEAAEVLEIAQWKTDEQVEASLGDPEVRRRLAEECADVFLYLLMLCERVGIDLPTVAAAKIELNEERYPADRVRGSSLKYDQF